VMKAGRAGRSRGSCILGELAPMARSEG
jgi:hypothetical protein